MNNVSLVYAFNFLFYYATEIAYSIFCVLSIFW